jgi:hypothetical protein
MESLKIVVVSILAAILYGIIHDQVTARVCLEYFTVFHPPIFHTQSPTLLALGRGVIATWWVGAFLGIFLALACRAGASPKLSTADILRPVGLLLLVMAVCAVVSGMVGFTFGRVPGYLQGLLPPNLERRFLADWWAHSASYAVGLLGGMVLCAIAVRKRLLLKQMPRLGR